MAANGSALFRSSHQRCSIKTGVLRNFAKFTGKHLCQRLFLNTAGFIRIQRHKRKILKRILTKLGLIKKDFLINTIDDM